MSPYRTAPTRAPIAPAPRWGVTQWRRFFVRWLLPLFAPDMLEAREEQRTYRRAMRVWKAEHAAFELEAHLHGLSIRERLKREPLPPLPPPKRIYE